MANRFCYRLALPLLTLLTACGSYDFKVNERVVYAPAPPFSDYEVPDPGLSACLEQAIADNVITAASQLESLNCSHAGISDLEGLGVFTGLTMLKLSSNNIRNLGQLAKLTLLEALYLDDNQVVDPVPLYQLPTLEVLDLAGNPALQCPKNNSFVLVESVSLPKHCH